MALEWNLQKPTPSAPARAEQRRVMLDGQAHLAPSEPNAPAGYTTPDIEQTPQQREQYASQMAFRQQVASQLLMTLREFTVRVLLARDELPPSVKQDLYNGLLTAASWLGNQ